jgi:NAD+ diphosphatase
MTSPQLGTLALARGTVDRVTARRADPDWLEAAWQHPRTRVLLVDDGKALVREDGEHAELQFVSPRQAPDGTRLLLGKDADGAVFFAVPADLAAATAPAPATPGPAGGVPSAPAGGVSSGPAGGVSSASAGRVPSAPPAPGGVRAATLRDVGALLGDRDAGLFVHAVALANWHAAHTHCPRCGAATVPGPGGHSARCPADGSEHFPRSDPAVIVLVTDPDDRCLLARNAAWPSRRVSILAGFVEAGESAEQAVVREVAEETGITVTDVRYVGSQPWPMPWSLMLGFRAGAAAGQRIAVDHEELAEARWFSRAGLLASLRSGEVALPPPVSIARRIIESWYGGPLPSAWPAAR